MPAGVTYQRLPHPDGVDMTALLDADSFDGKIYAIAQYADGSIFHFYDGARVSDWEVGVVRAGMATNAGIAAHLASLITADAAVNATAFGNVIVVTASVVNTPFTITAEATNAEGGTDNQSAAVTTPTAAAGGIAQVSNVTIAGTFDIGDRFTVLINSVKYGAKFMPAVKGTACRTHKSKMYACCGSLLQFSGINDATAWNSLDDTGASFINMSNQDGGSETLVGLGLFQKNLAIFSENVIQTWSMNADPALNAQLQVLNNTGTTAHKSIIAYGNQDIAYLDKTGIRGLQARTAVADLASVNDIGTPIDTYVQAHVKTISETVRDATCAAIDPYDSRLWMAIGNKIFVYTSFPSAKINAWTTYEPGFQVDAMVSLNRRNYVRSGDTIYKYGGDDNETYDSSEVTVTLPYFHDNKPANYRELRGFDADLANLWAVTVLVDPRDTTQYVDIGNLEGLTYVEGDIGIPCRSPFSAPKFVCNSAGYARISNFAVHFQKGPVEAA
jgi:hypothetical protein